jgi:hypothetical protein
MSSACHLRKLRGLLGEVWMILDMMYHLLQKLQRMFTRNQLSKYPEEFNIISVSKESTRGSHWILGRQSS